MACIWAGISNGSPWRLCQSAMVAIFVVVVPVSLRPMLFAIVSETLCTSVPDLSTCETRYLVIISNQLVYPVLVRIRSHLEFSSELLHSTR
jgi:hypothetical protein